VSKTSFCDGIKGGSGDWASGGVFSGKLEVETIFSGKWSEFVEIKKSWDNGLRFFGGSEEMMFRNLVRIVERE